HLGTAITSGQATDDRLRRAPGKRKKKQTTAPRGRVSLDKGSPHKGWAAGAKPSARLVPTPPTTSLPSARKQPITAPFREPPCRATRQTPFPLSTPRRALPSGVMAGPPPVPAPVPTAGVPRLSAGAGRQGSPFPLDPARG